MGFQCIQSDHELYIFLRDGVRLVMPVFVDDITLACSEGAKIDTVVQILSLTFFLAEFHEVAPEPTLTTNPPVDFPLSAFPPGSSPK